jgi:hypothetical protein
MIDAEAPNARRACAPQAKPGEAEHAILFESCPWYGIRYMLVGTHVVAKCNGILKRNLWLVQGDPAQASVTAGEMESDCVSFHGVFHCEINLSKFPNMASEK